MYKNLLTYLNVSKDSIYLTNTLENIDKYFENYDIVLDTNDYFLYKKRKIGISKAFLKQYEIDNLFLKVQKKINLKNL